MFKKKIFVYLTGGLGNQLFQMAAARSRGNGKLVVEKDLGSPRLNRFGAPDIDDYIFPFKFAYHGSPLLNSNVRFFNKVPGYILFNGLSSKGLRVSRVFRFVIRLVGSIIFSIAFRSPISITQATNNGFCQLKNKRINEFLIGYFQSYYWLQSLGHKDSFSQIALKSPSKVLINFINNIKNYSLVMVHVRLGDYKNEKSFGIPNINYYAKALDSIFSQGDFDHIMLFSNEPGEAMNYIPSHFHEMILIAPEFDGRAAETLEAMRHMDAYIIANSTLSWWGAYLSYKEAPPVVSPEPWFQLSPEPQNMIPHHWSRIVAWPNPFSE